MIDIYLNQVVTLKTPSSINDYNEASYTTKNIPARFEYKRKLVRKPTGENIISEAQCYTETQVKPDDVITYDGKDWPVISVKDQVGLDGSVQFYEVSL